MREGDDRGVRIERRGGGYAATGPGFYVWDEDARALLASAGELADAARRRRAGLPPAPGGDRFTAPGDPSRPPRR